jgi:ATP-binding cassette subfamily B protein
MHPLIKLIRYSGKYKIDISLATLYSVLNKLFDILPEVLIGVAVDVVVKRQHSMLANIGISNVVEQIVVLGILTGVIWMLESLFQYLYSLKWCYLAQNLQHDMRLDTYNHVQNLTMEYFENKAMGNMMSILNDDINQLERFLNDGVNQIIQILISTVVITIIFFIISTKIALLTFIPIPLILLGSFYFRKKLAPRYLNVRNQAGLVNNKLNNNLAGIATIKSFTTEEYEVNSLDKLSTSYSKANKNAIVLSAAITPVIRMAIMLGFLISLIYGGIMTIEGSIEVASYSILIFLSQRLLWPLTYLATVIDTYQRSMASVNRVMDLLNTPITIVGGEHKITNITGITFDNVSFAYPSRQNILNKISFFIPPNQTVAFVGSTGSGKSTLVKLLMRFYDINSGNISINGIDIKELNIKSLRQNIGLVSQDTFLIDGTIAENISYGSFDKTLDEIIDVAKIANIDTFIMSLPDNYNTHIGERGQKLSGGQRQRIALARAILKNPPLLILDEATSSLDNKTESLIQSSLELVKRGRTTIIIAHRLSTIVNANMIHVVANGHIIESGTHNELLNTKGVYADLWNLQLRESESMVK